MVLVQPHASYAKDLSWSALEFKVFPPTKMPNTVDCKSFLKLQGQQATPDNQGPG